MNESETDSGETSDVSMDARGHEPSEDRHRDPCAPVLNQHRGREPTRYHYPHDNTTGAPSSRNSYIHDPNAPAHRIPISLSTRSAGVNTYHPGQTSLGQSSNERVPQCRICGAFHYPGSSQCQVRSLLYNVPPYSLNCPQCM